MTRAYTPSSTYAGPLLVTHVEASMGEPDLGWSAFVHGPISTIEVPGTHDSMVRRPYVTTLGAQLARALDKAR
jgi:thioesterase domain-containing protein